MAIKLSKGSKRVYASSDVMAFAQLVYGRLHSDIEKQFRGDDLRMAFSPSPSPYPWSYIFILCPVEETEQAVRKLEALPPVWAIMYDPNDHPDGNQYIYGLCDPHTDFSKYLSSGELKDIQPL